MLHWLNWIKFSSGRMHIRRFLHLFLLACFDPNSVLHTGVCISSGQLNDSSLRLCKCSFKFSIFILHSIWWYRAFLFPNVVIIETWFESECAKKWIESSMESIRSEREHLMFKLNGKRLLADRICSWNARQWPPVVVKWSHSNIQSLLISSVCAH